MHGVSKRLHVYDMACCHSYPVCFQVNWEIRADHQAGDFGFDPLGLKPTDPAEFVEMQPGQLIAGALTE